MTETPQQMARRLMDEVDVVAKEKYTKGDVKMLLNAIAQKPAETPSHVSEEGCRSPVACVDLRRGDVFISKVTGGKVRPWVVLHVAGQNVVAVAMSSGDSVPGAQESRCRFWPGSFIGTTTSVFTKDYAAQEVTRPYTARSHLHEIENILKAMYCFTPKRKKGAVSRLRVAS